MSSLIVQIWSCCVLVKVEVANICLRVSNIRQIKFLLCHWKWLRTTQETIYPHLTTLLNAPHYSFLKCNSVSVNPSEHNWISRNTRQIIFWLCDHMTKAQLLGDGSSLFAASSSLAFNHNPAAAHYQVDPFFPLLTVLVMICQNCFILFYITDLLTFVHFRCYWKIVLCVVNGYKVTIEFKYFILHFCGWNSRLYAWL